ncbi:MAG: hypothetical protein AB7P76_06905 [Candidatus Melainabacteria bacterium]
MDTLYLSGRPATPEDARQLTLITELLRDYAFPVVASFERFPADCLTPDLESPIRDGIHHTVMMVGVFFGNTLDPVTCYELTCAHQAAIPIAAVCAPALNGRPPEELPAAIREAMVRLIDLPGDPDLLINPLISVINRHRLV